MSDERRGMRDEMESRSENELPLYDSKTSESMLDTKIMTPETVITSLPGTFTPIRMLWRISPKEHRQSNGESGRNLERGQAKINCKCVTMLMVSEQS